jgi:prepilin-type N-terminal cleavage/methylation domain-containing protein
MTMVRRLDERGMSLPEILIALLVFSAIMAGVLGVLNRENKMMWRATERMNALQNVRYAADIMEQEFRTAGAVTLGNQPFVVYADTHVFAFNANYVTNTSGDFTAVYYDPDAPDAIAQSLLQSQRFTFPLTSFAYPDTTYKSSVGVVSNAETIIFYFTLDTSTTRTDDYLLYRQVNNQPPEVVSRNLLRTAGTPWFTYTSLVSPPSATAYIATVPAGNLPLKHSVKLHISPADTGVAARVDSLRGVKITLTATNGLTGPEERKRTISRTIRLPNAGLVNRANCGDEPFSGIVLTPTPTVVVATGERQVRLNWNPASDEFGGEKDVVRYVLWRRRPADPAFTDLDPYVSIPAGVASYVYFDEDAVAGDVFYYAIAAQDCTPSLSSLTTVGPVNVP